MFVARTTTGIMAVVLPALLAVGPASADGTLEATPGAWAQKMSDAELAQRRGMGVFHAIGFNVVANGSVAEGEEGSPDGISIEGGDAQVSAFVGRGFDGSSGIFQINQVPGNRNVVTNNLYVQIAIVELMDSTAMSNPRQFFNDIGFTGLPSP